MTGRRASQKFFWILRNVVISSLFFSPLIIALVALANSSSRSPGVPIAYHVAEAVAFLWVLTLPGTVSLAATLSGIVVALSFLLSGKRLRVAATATLLSIAVLGMSGYVASGARSGSSLPEGLSTVAPSNLISIGLCLACIAAYGWLSAIPPKGVSTRCRWEAIIADGMFILSLLIPVLLIGALTIYGIVLSIYRSVL